MSEHQLWIVQRLLEHCRAGRLWAVWADPDGGNRVRLAMSVEYHGALLPLSWGEAEEMAYWPEPVPVGSHWYRLGSGAFIARSKGMPFQRKPLAVALPASGSMSGARAGGERVAGL